MKYDYKDKANNILIANKYMLAKTIHMFQYENLPETIPHRELERLLQENGFAFITEVEGNLYAFNGGLGGVPDAYGNPTEIVIANPYLNFNKTLKLTEGVLIINDDYKLGLIPLFTKYNTLLSENDINMVMYSFASRMTRFVSASDDSTRESAQRVIDKAIEGEAMVASENVMFDGIRVQGDSSRNGDIQPLIEYTNYLKASMLHEVGLSANNNMKRERLITAEVEQSDNGLFTFVFNMMACRNEAIEKLNEKYSLNIKLSFGSVWLDKRKEVVDDIVDNENINTDQTPEDTQGSDDEQNMGDGSKDAGTTDLPASGEETGLPTGESETQQSAEHNPLTPAEEAYSIECAIKEVEDNLQAEDITPEATAELTELLEQYQNRLAELNTTP